MQGADTDFNELISRISGESKRILIITHRNPDGDAIGSSLGLYHLLSDLGHEVSVMVPNRFPAFLSWMEGAREIVIFNHQTERGIKLLSEAEILFALDFNDLSRIREFEEHIDLSRTYKVLIDHHPFPGDFADFSFCDTTVSSTAELIYEFIRRSDLEHLLSLPAAECIYAGIMTDTGCFSFNSSRPETFQIVSGLLKHGIDKDKIYDRVYDNFSYERMRLMGYCLDRKMKYLPELKTAYLTLTQEEMRLYNFKIGDSEGFVNLPLSIKDVRFSVLITEQKDVVKLSFRSKGNFAVNDIASKYFNGGGHRNAAGGESTQSLEDTVNKFLEIIPNYKDELQNEA